MQGHFRSPARKQITELQVADEYVLTAQLLMTLLVKPHFKSHMWAFTELTMSLTPVLLSRFLLHLCRCAAERQAQVSSFSNLSTVLASAVARSSTLDEFNSDFTISNDAREL